ncbi:hypothetical protein ACIRPK_12075 [Kitasatospora sp. NPDC101801]|uniref:hypothetical protein n=1 Tax=Kitasatospora sp. NPDC101801 TaxID=3364103 RepID=UPI003807B698
MGSTDSTAPASDARSASGPAHRPERARTEGSGARAGAPAWRFLPALTAYLVLVGVLLAADTSPGDIARYTGYVAWGVLLPGTLVFRALRRRPYTLVEDLAFGAVTGLVLELLAWAVFMAAGIESVMPAWPLLVAVPFAAVPRLRRHWRPRGYLASSLGWSWAVAGTVAVSSGYLYAVFLRKYPVVPVEGHANQYVDLPYLLSLAGNAKHNFPLTFPQAAGEPLHYHWFTFVHMAMTDMVGHIDLAVVQMRLMVPALVALTLVITAVVARRLTGRAWAGPVAAVLVFLIGDFNAIYPNNVQNWTFGAPAVPLMAWASLSLTYSQPLLIALIGVVGDALRGRRERADGEAPGLGRGVFVLTAMFALASSAAKASSLPVTVAALAFAGLMVLIGTRRIPWTVVGLGAILGAVQLFATAVLFRFESYGLQVVPFGNVERYWADPLGTRSTTAQAAVVALTLVAYLLNHQLRMVGAIPLIWRRRLRMDPVQWFLLGGAVAGPAVYLVVNGFNASYFTLAGIPFGVLLSAWGYCEVFERAALSTRAKVLLVVGTLSFTALLTVAVYRYADDWATFVLKLFDDGTGAKSYSVLLPALGAAAALAAIAAVLGLLWRGAGRLLPGLRRRGGVVLLTAALTAGAPTLVLDVAQTSQSEWMGTALLPAEQVQAARWVRAHSSPSDVLATNSHCRSFDDYGVPGEVCTNNAQSFWLSGYSERSVLVEGWAYSPRLMSEQSNAFWDLPLLKLNEDAVYAPTAELLHRLHAEHHVRYLVVDRKVHPESALLKSLARPVYDNGRVAVYELS